jgi:hypothetical protein
MARFDAGYDAVPYLSKTQIKREAAILLSEYGAKFSAVVEPPVPVEDILEIHLQLAFELVDMKAIFGYGDVLGAIWMTEKTVRVDKSLDPVLFPRIKGRNRFTLAHEVGHWQLHRRYYTPDAAQGVFFNGQGKPAFVCRSSESSKPVEWQANYFAAHLLMPSNLLRAAWEKWRGNLSPVGVVDLVKNAGDPPGLTTGAIVERFLRPLADTFEVSGEAMRIRAEELGLVLPDKAELLF